MEAITRENVLDAARSGDDARLLAMFDASPDRVRRFLTSLSYHPTSTFHPAVMSALQMFSHERSDAMPDFFLETIRRHIWAMNEEGGNIDWAAPESIGAVIAGNPDRFGGFFSFAFEAAVEELTFQPSLVAAFDRVAAVDADLVEPFRAAIEELRGTIAAEKPYFV